MSKLRLILGNRIIAFPAAIAKIIGINETLILSQLCYWSERVGDEEGWLYKTIKEMEDETSLTREMQDRAIHNLIALGLIEVKVKGLPPKRHFRIIWDAIDKLGDENTQTLPPYTNSDLCETHKTICGKPANKFVENPQINLCETHKSICVKHTNLFVENPQIEECSNHLQKDNRDTLYIDYNNIYNNNNNNINAETTASHTHTEEEKGDKTRTDYTDAFLSVWKAYPHIGTRSKKMDSYKVWKKRNLEKWTDIILKRIEIMKRTISWIKGYIPGLQVFFRQFDPSETTIPMDYIPYPVSEEILHEARKKARDNPNEPQLQEKYNIIKELYNRDHKNDNK